MRLVDALTQAPVVREWNIGVTDLKLEDLLGEDEAVDARVLHPHVRWLPKPWFISVQADPALIEEDGRLFLYYEEVLCISTKGRLRACELPRDGDASKRRARRLGKPMIRLRGHAAYPYVFKYEGGFYCVPDTGTSNRVALYESTSPLGPWTIHSTLLDGIGARDSTVFPFGDRWWLLCTVAGDDPQSAFANLHIWHASEPWGPWLPHRLQPAKIDVRSSRPAGRPFLVDGALYRPAQDCGLRYGARTVINRVSTLTPEEFSEEACCYLEPDPDGHYSSGLHTVAVVGDLVLVDGLWEGYTPNPFKTLTAFVSKIRVRL
jgi:hypothetical protein